MSAKLNPLSLVQSNIRRQGRIKFIDIEPPIESEIRDSKSVNQSFEEFPIIPYSGVSNWSSQKLVSVLYNIKHISSTFASILEGTKIYSLRDKVSIIKTYDDDYEIEINDTVGEAEKKQFVDELNKNFIFSNESIKGLAEMLSESYDSVGMLGCEVVFMEVLGIPQITVKYIHPTDYVFKRNDIPGTEVYISKDWSYDYLKLYPPQILPVFPLIYSYPDGTERTFFYRKNGGFLYGRPMDLACIYDKYNEWKLKQYLTKKNKKMWLPSVFIEYEDGNIGGGLLDDTAAISAGFKNSADRVQDSFTNKGDDPMDVMVSTRPNGASAAFVHEFQGLKGSKEIQQYLDICEDNIVKANNWSKMLMMGEGTTGFSSNVFLDVFEIASITKISERQQLLGNFINKILKYGFERIGIKTDLGIKFNSPFQNMLNERNATRGGNTAQPSTGTNTK